MTCTNEAELFSQLKDLAIFWKGHRAMLGYMLIESKSLVEIIERLLKEGD